MPGGATWGSSKSFGMRGRGCREERWVTDVTLASVKRTGVARPMFLPIMDPHRGLLGKRA